MPIVAETYQWVLGVDTHAETHSYALVAAATGALSDHQTFPTTPAGLTRALSWLERRTEHHPTGGVLISCEGTNSYGAGLARRAAATGYRVVDAPSPQRPRGTGKNDQIDALTAARAVLAHDTDHLADARTGQLRSALATLLTARNALTSERTRAVNAINALLRTHDLGIDARHKVTRPTLHTITGWRPRTNDTIDLRIARAEAVRLATRITELDKAARANLTQLADLLAQTPAATLLDHPGIGPVNAAQILVSWSHPGRVRNHNAFAKLAGVSPLETTSGKRTTGHRLNRTGDRQLNRALHSIANTRMRTDPRTRAYLTRRTAEGLTKPRIRRCLKRYIAREIYHLLNP